MLWQALQEQTVDLGWEFYCPVLLIVALIALAVPVWAAIGIGAVTMLLVTDVLPISLLGESLFDGIDHFALIAVPLFILTGDVLVRTGLSNKLLDVADATTGGFRAGSRHGDGARLRLLRLHLGLRRRRRRGGRAHDHPQAGRQGLPAPLRLRAGRLRRLHGNPDPALDRLHHHRADPRHLRLYAVPGGGHSRRPDHAVHHGHQHGDEPDP